MTVTQEFAHRFARATCRLDGEGIAQVSVTGVFSHAAEFQRWLLAHADAIHARGIVVDLRRAAVAVDWAAHVSDPDAMPQGRMLAVAIVVNQALLDDMRDVAWRRGKQGFMRSAFPDAASATTWVADRGWVGSL